MWGDPHIRTFDGTRADYYSPGEYWIVKTDVIWIQARYLPTKFTNGLAVTKMLAVGGPLLKGSKLIIAPTYTTWNGRRVLTGFPSHFDRHKLVHVDYDDQGALVDSALDATKKHVVRAGIFDGTPEGITIQVNRWLQTPGSEYINVRIRMHPRPGQDGHCGNFNGNPIDDDRLQVRKRIGKTGVAQPELLFWAKTPTTTVGRPDINDCEMATLHAAEAECKATFGGKSPKFSCLLDYCFAGKEVALNR